MGGFYVVCNHCEHRNYKQDAARVNILSSVKSRTFEMITLAASCSAEHIFNTYVSYRLQTRNPHMVHQTAAKRKATAQNNQH